MVYYVVGGGIGGLAFAISYTLSVQQQLRQQSGGGGATLSDYHDIVVLEKEVDDTFYLSKKFTHSLSIRSRTGALGALQELGVLEAVRSTQSAARVDYFAYSTPRGIFPAWATDWMMMSSSSKSKSTAEEDMIDTTSIRTSRGSLWKALYDRAIDLGVTVRFNCNVKEVDLETGRIVLKRRGDDGEEAEEGVAEANETGLVVVASGAWSDLAGSTPLRSLPYAMLGGMVTIPSTKDGGSVGGEGWPQHVFERHAIIFSNSGEAMTFLSHEQGNEVSMGVAFRVDKPIDRTDPDAVAEANQYGIQLVRDNLPEDIASLFIAQVLSSPSGGAPLLVNCRDRQDMLISFQNNPNEGGSCGRSHNRVLRLGDAWHAISPYAGVGANMAVVDGLELAVLVGTGGGSGGVDFKILGAASMALQRRWRKMFTRQSVVINFAHGTSWWMVVVRGVVLRGLRVCLNPQWNYIRRAVGVGLAAAAVASLWCGVV